MIYVGAVLLACALLGGGWGWYRGTRRFRRRSPHSERSDDLSPAEYARQRIGILRRQRLVLTIAYAVIGTAGGMAFLFFLAHRT